MDKIFFPQQPIQPIGAGKARESYKTPKEGGTDFDRILDSQMRGGLKFSKHARERLAQRNIVLSNHDMTRLSNAVGKAREKGARDSLIVMDRLALVVSVKNNTVITAVDDESITENVFTNIDSAVII